MRKTVILLVLASLVLSSCGWRDSRVNPRNWFGDSRSEARVPQETTQTNALIPPARRGIFARPEAEDRSVLIAEVTALRIEPTNSGAIILATGTASRQGGYASELRLLDDSPDGVLSYEFRVVYPVEQTPTGSALTRTVNEAITLTRQDLAGIRTIRVIAAQNQRESRRGG